jgi:hypothetical protein
MLDSQLFEKLEVLVLDMLIGARRNPSIREEEVHVTRSAPVETEPDGRTGECRKYSSLEGNLEAEEEVKAPFPEKSAHRNEPLHPLPALEDEDLVHIWMPANEARRPSLEDPGNPAVGPLSLESANDWEDMDSVPDRAQHHDEDVPRFTLR